jgi:GNAT superfamily N-acetyltransferase
MRSAGAEEVDTIARLAGEIWRACYPEILTTAQIEYMLTRMYSLDTLREEILSGGIHYELLSIGDDPAGFASYGPTEAEGTFKLHKLYVLPKWHGEGLGSALLRHCEQAARDGGARKLILNVNKRNRRAIQAYERNGYRTVRAETNDIGNGFVMDDYVMAKDVAG